MAGGAPSPGFVAVKCAVRYIFTAQPVSSSPRTTIRNNCSCFVSLFTLPVYWKTRGWQGCGKFWQRHRKIRRPRRGQAQTGKRHAAIRQNGRSNRGGAETAGRQRAEIMTRTDPFSCAPSGDQLTCEYFTTLAAGRGLPALPTPLAASAAENVTSDG